MIFCQTSVFIIAPHTLLLTTATTTTSLHYILHELQPENVRWYFAAVDASKNVSFEPFCAHDSLCLESRYRQLTPSQPSEADAGMCGHTRVGRVCVVLLTSTLSVFHPLIYICYRPPIQQPMSSWCEAPITTSTFQKGRCALCIGRSSLLLLFEARGSAHRRRVRSIRFDWRIE